MNETDNLLPHLRLNFNVQHPSVEECYLFGFECAKQGLDESENPYPVQSKECFYWQEGYWDAIYEEEPLFQDEGVETDTSVQSAANDTAFYSKPTALMLNFLKITGALAATIIVGYQVFELVA